MDGHSGEMFDVVDRDNCVIGQAPRGEVHARGLLHRAVHVLVHNATGGLFLQRRSMSKDTFPGCWDSSCSGHLDAGEDYVTAARRELGEELGWHDSTQALRHVVRLPACAETGQEFIDVFVLGPVEGPFVLHPEEIAEGRWAMTGELDALLREHPENFASALRLLWAEYREAILEMLPLSPRPG